MICTSVLILLVRRTSQDQVSSTSFQDGTNYMLQMYYIQGIDNTRLIKMGIPQ